MDVSLRSPIIISRLFLGLYVMKLIGLGFDPFSIFIYFLLGFVPTSLMFQIYICLSDKREKIK
jgi:hypothetical protein